MSVRCLRRGARALLSCLPEGVIHTYIHISAYYSAVVGKNERYLYVYVMELMIIICASGLVSTIYLCLELFSRYLQFACVLLSPE